MQITAIANAEVKCIGATTHSNNNRINNKNCNNNTNNIQLNTSKTIVRNMAAATISAMTDDADSGCFKLSIYNSNSDNIQRCGKNVDYVATTTTTAATITTPTTVAKSNRGSTTSTQCCMKDGNSQVRLTERNANSNNNKYQHTCAVVCEEDNFVASESATKMQDCKHSAVIRNSGGSSSNLREAVKVSSAGDTIKTTIIRTSLSMGSWKRVLAMLMLLFCFAWQDYAQAALSNVNLFIEPPAVRRGQSVILRCQYALDGAPLYSIKYYRGNYEFYRYTPGEFPNVKHFQYPGIKVDEAISNATQVVIRDVKFSLSGNFSCEVTADAPLFSTATAYAQVQVVEFPEKRPQLFTEHARYEPGDILRANCSTPPSRPRADLHFTLNNIPVSTGETQYIRTVDNLIASRLSLKLQLHAAHFAAAINTQHLMNNLGGSQSSMGLSYNTNGGGGGGIGVVGNGGLVLRCTAQIGDLYQEYKEIELGTPQKDPVPARVTLSSGSSLSNFFEYFSSASSSAASANILTTTSTTTRRTTTSSFLAYNPLKLTILAAAVWRTQALLLDVAVGVVDGVYNTLRLKQAIMRSGNNNNNNNNNIGR